jgi:hypothetical protein
MSQCFGQYVCVCVKLKIHQYVICDFLLMMDVKEWMSYCINVHMLATFIIHVSTRSHASEEEYRTRNHSKNAIVKNLKRWRWWHNGFCMCRSLLQ